MLESGNYVGEQIEQAAKRRFTSHECEENIIRRMLKRTDDAEEAIEALSEQDFSDVSLGQLFTAVKTIIQDGRQVDFAAVDNAFTKLYPSMADAIRDRMIDLVKQTPYTLADSQSIRDHIKIVKELSTRRAIIRRMDELSAKLRDPGQSITETLTAIQDAAEAVDGDDEATWTSLTDVNIRTYEYLSNRAEGKIKAITTGIKSLDEITGGLFGGELTIVAARPSVGKSAFGLNVAMSAAREGVKVGFVSCEMDDKGFGQRTLSRASWVRGEKLRKAQITPEDWGTLYDAMSAMQELPVQFMFNHGGQEGWITIESVFRAARKAVRHNQMDLLIVDYIGIMRTVKAFKEERLRIAYISSELKRLAMALNIPVLALCQVNRMAQGRMPTMAELRDSGAVEQDADGIIFLHRPETHEDKSIHPKDVPGFYAMQEGGNVYIAINVSKQRNGATGITQVMFDPEVMRYSEIMREDV